MLKYQIAGFGFHLFCQRSRSDVIQSELLTIFGFQQTLNAIQIVGVFFLLFTVQAQFFQYLILEVFGIGYRSQLLLRAVLQNACGVVRLA